MDALTTEINALSQSLISQLKSPIPLLNALTEHLFSQPGKNIRAQLMIKLAYFLKQDPFDHQFLRAAGIIELIHTGTLVHDDVIDQNPLRRNRLTTHEVFGNTCSILLGDYLFTKAYLMAQELNCRELFLPDLALTAHALVEGELLQLQQKESVLSFDDYNSIIRLKTATLFGFACKSVAQLYAPKLQGQFEQVGLLFGELFQLIDDYQDYFGTESVLGKPPGQDFKEKKMTLPVLVYGQQTDRCLADFFEKNICFESTKTLLFPIRNACLKKIDIVLQRFSNMLLSLELSEHIMPLLDRYLASLQIRSLSLEPVTT